MASPPMTEATGRRIVELLERIAVLLEDKQEPELPRVEPRFDLIPPKGKTSRDGVR